MKGVQGQLVCQLWYVELCQQVLDAVFHEGLVFCGEGRQLVVYIKGQRLLQAEQQKVRTWAHRGEVGMGSYELGSRLMLCCSQLQLCAAGLVAEHTGSVIKSFVVSVASYAKL